MDSDRDFYRFTVDDFCVVNVFVVELTAFSRNDPVTIIWLVTLSGLKGTSLTVPWSLVENRSFVSSFVQGFLPGLALKLFFKFLPKFIKIITKLEGHLAVSKIERRAAAKYYIFVVVNIFFGSIFTGTAFQQLKTFVTSSSFLEYVPLIHRVDSYPYCLHDKFQSRFCNMES